jgi:hypothetical protein
MCTNFTKLNKCYPKDDFPLVRIDKIVDSTIGCKMLALLDCFSGYHQNLWSLRMPKVLHNAGPSFCRIMKVALKDQVSRNVLSYVNDIVVARKEKTSYISNLAETFANIHEARLKLNPEKCVFGGHERQSAWVLSLYERHRSKS